MIKKGELYGLEEESLSAIYTKAKYQSEKEARLNKKTVQKRHQMTHVDDNVDGQGNDESHLQGEESSKAQGYHARDQTSGALSNANDEWKKRTSKGVCVCVTLYISWGLDVYVCIVILCFSCYFNSLFFLPFPPCSLSLSEYLIR